ncbi:MAG: hypothetical protein II662_00595 [Bacteroidales bacterium]|nr:hypothetical protein [Bacteroidales bacterium]
MEKLKKKRKAFVLLMALAAVMASPPCIRAQGTDMYFESQAFGDDYHYGFSHEGFGDDYIYGFSHQIYGSDYIYGFSHQMFGDDYIYGFTHESFGDDFTGNFGHQGFGQPAPLGSGIIVLLAAGANYAFRRTRSKKENKLN